MNTLKQFLKKNYQALIPKFRFFRENIFKFEINKLRIKAIKYASGEDATKSYLIKCIRNGNIVSGSIPILNKDVEVILYNFLSLNYGIRKNFWLNIALTNKNFKVNKSILINISHRSIKTLKIRNLLKINTNDVFCVISAIDKLIPVNHGEKKYHFGHLRFFGIWDKSCYIHSVPLPSPSELFKNRLGLNLNRNLERVYTPNPQKTYISSFGSNRENLINKSRKIKDKIPKDFSNIFKLPQSNFLGYLSVRNSSNKIKSISHFSTNTRNSRQQKIIPKIFSKNSYEHIISIPPIKNIDAYLFFGEACSNQSNFKVVFLEKNNETASFRNKKTKEIKIINNDLPIKASSLFPELLDIENPCILSFTPTSGNHSNQYIGINYILNNEKGEEEICDTVHSDIYSKYGLRRTLKFGPFLVGKLKSKNDNEIYESYLSILSSKEKPTNIRIRIFKENDPSFELLIMKRIEYSTVTMFPISKLISNQKLLYLENLISGICQIECEEANLTGNIFISKTVNNQCKSIAVDHLTGG